MRIKFRFSNFYRSEDDGKQFFLFFSFFAWLIVVYTMLSFLLFYSQRCLVFPNCLIRGVLRTLSNTLDGTFCKSISRQLFSQMAPPQMFDRVLNKPLLIIINEILSHFYDVQLVYFFYNVYVASASCNGLVYSKLYFFCDRFWYVSLQITIAY